MTGERTARRIAVEMEPLIQTLRHGAAAARAVHMAPDALLYITETLERDAEKLKLLWRELWDMTHKDNQPPLQAVEE